MTVYEDKEFDGAAFVLEESIFIRCKLTNCHLFYSGGDYNILDTIINKCQFHYGIACNGTIKLLQLLGYLPKELAVEEKKPVVN